MIGNVFYRLLLRFDFRATDMSQKAFDKNTKAAVNINFPTETFLNLIKRGRQGRVRESRYSID